MTFKLLLVAAFIAMTSARSTFPPKVTGPRRDDIEISGVGAAALCDGKNVGIYELPFGFQTLFPQYGIKDMVDNSAKPFLSFFLVCAVDDVLVRPCATDNTFFSQKCGQCLYSSRILEGEVCHTTQPWQSVAQPNCPPKNDAAATAACRRNGPEYCGNTVDVRGNPTNAPSKIYLSCWMGHYVTCVFCQNDLYFYEGVNWAGEPDTMGHCEKLV